MRFSRKQDVILSVRWARPEPDTAAYAVFFRVNMAYISSSEAATNDFSYQSISDNQEISELAALAKNTPMSERVGRIYLNDFRLAEDRQRNAFMFQTGAVARDTSLQSHYLLYFMRHWFDIRSRGNDTCEVSFYDFPPELDADRKWIEQCFGQAARIYGWADGCGGDTNIFDPVFCDDDWYPG